METREIDINSEKIEVRSWVQFVDFLASNSLYSGWVLHQPPQYSTLIFLST